MKTCVLVCGAGFATDDFCERRARGEFDCVVAVDLGYEHLRRLEERAGRKNQTNAGAYADVVLGDFDSLGYVPADALAQPAIKDKSDLELALDWACEQGFCNIIVYGCLGARIDHTLAALQTLTCVVEERHIRVRAVGDEVCSVRSNAEAAIKNVLHHANIRLPYTEVLEIVAGPSTLNLNVSPNATPEEVPALGAPTYGNVSVFSATPQSNGVTLTGMFYSLNNATINNRTSLGLSNELIEQTGTVSVQKGTLYVVYPSTFCATLNECGVY